MNKKAQQEMIGFVLIVTIVVVALVVFLVMSLNKKADIPQSKMANNLLGTILGTTTKCSFNYASANQTLNEILSEKYSGGSQRCFGSGLSLDSALNESLGEIVGAIASFEDVISFYDFKVYLVEDGQKLEYQYSLGNCSGSVYSSEPLIVHRISEDSYYTANLVICVED